MRLTESIKKNALSLAEDIQVADVRIGLGYTAVLLENGNAGLAYTFRDNLQGGCSAYQNIRPLAGRPAKDLIQLFDLESPLETAIALATANALFNVPGRNYFQGDIIEHLDLNPNDHVGMVGHFGPLAPVIKQKVNKLYIFEQIDFPQANLLPIKEAGNLLPKCQTALITSTTIINHTIDQLLELTDSCRNIILLGASTPLTHTVFENTQVSMLSGVIVDNPEAVLQVVSEGGGMQQFKPFIGKTNMRL